MKLHKRMIKAEFWKDGDLALDFSRDERFFYIGLWQIADDSGCLDRNSKDIKMHLFPSDADVTPGMIDGWLDHLVDAEKLIAYAVGGKQCLFIVSFHEHQTLDRPVGPTSDSTPLPPWVIWEEGDTRRKSRYVVLPDNADQGPDNGRPQDGQRPTGEQPRDGQGPTGGQPGGGQGPDGGQPPAGQGPDAAPLESELESEQEVQAGDESSTPDMPSGTSPNMPPDALPNTPLDTLPGTPPETPPKKPKLTSVPSSPQAELFEHYVMGWQRRYETEDRPPGGKADYVQLDKLVKGYGLEKCKKLVDAYLAVTDDAFFEGHPLNKFYSGSTVTRLLSVVNGGGDNGRHKRGNGANAGGLGGSGRFTPPAPRSAFTHTGVVKDW